MAPDRSFVDFYQREFGRMVHSLRPYAGSAAEDIAQEAFLAAHERWADVARLDVPYAWIRRVGIRMAGRRAQRDRLRATLEESISQLDADIVCDLDLIAALAGLSGRQATAVWLHHMEGRPVVEVAELLDCTVPAAKVLLHRARRRLAERAGGLHGRWVSERRWSTDEIVNSLRAQDVDEHVEQVVVDDLEGIGGRWEFTVVNWRYELKRDDGLELDAGSVNVRGDTVELIPANAPGHVVFTSAFDGDRIRLRQIENTTPPTRGVPDLIWMGLFLGSGSFSYAGRART